MNNLYHRHDEQMVNHEMKEVDRAVEQARLLKEASLARPGLLARVAASLGKLLLIQRQRIQARDYKSEQSYSSTDERSAP